MYIISYSQVIAASDIANVSEQVLEILYDFESSSLDKDIKLSNAKGSIVDEDSKALKVQFDSKDHRSASLSIIPDKPFNWSTYEDFHIAFDISNAGEHSVNIQLDVSDTSGGNYTRAVNIPTGESQTYYAKIEGHDLATPEGRGDIELNLLSGLRNNPPTWDSEDTQFISLWGKKNLDTSAIQKISIGVKYNLFNKEITIDNIRLRKNPPLDPLYLTGIVDKFGQSAKQEFPGKVLSDAQLLENYKQEKKLLDGILMPDRSTFGGYKHGKKQPATGYFRTAKIDGKWSLVDPEGYPYFATGLDIIRLGDAATMTGYDFKQTNDKSSRYVEFKKRADMFEWLPKYGEPLAVHFGYVSNVHSGALDKGETFNFQRANLQRKYGTNYEQKWLEVTVDRMINWGFTSLGNWTSPKLYQNNKIPYFANGWIRGNYKTVSSGQDFWGALPDVFDPVFAKQADISVRKVAAEVKDSPWCVGVFIDNEKSFGRSESDDSRLGIVINTLSRDGATVPTKAHFTSLMKTKYGTIAALNKSWGKNIANWKAFEQGIEASLTSDAQIKDYQDLLHAYADKYFSVVNKAMKTHMPNRLYLGARFPDWGMPQEVVRASAKHVDVISFNVYKEGLVSGFWDFLDMLEKPAIIGEFHMGAMDRGMFHPGIIIASDQHDRAKMFKDYLYSVIDNPNFVGAHYFQYADGPLTGRAYDGENYNIGFISVTDTPYKEMVQASQKLNSQLYHRRYESK